MSEIIAPQRGSPFLSGLSTLSLRNQIWAEAVSKLSIIRGEGSPEGVIEAEEDRFYRDTTQTTQGLMVYIKASADISGDRTMGWVLI